MCFITDVQQTFPDRDNFGLFPQLISAHAAARTAGCKMKKRGSLSVNVYVQNVKVRLMTMVLISQFGGIHRRDVIGVIDRSALASSGCQFIFFNCALSADETNVQSDSCTSDLDHGCLSFFKEWRT